MHNENEISNTNSLPKIAVVSAITAVSAFILVFFFSNYSSLFFAYDFDIPATFDLNGISFLDVDGSLNWSRDAIITILLSKPISSLFGGILFLIILMLGTKKSVTIILLLFWLNVFAFNFAFGALLDDTIFHIGTYHVATAMNIGNSYLVIMLIIMAFIFYKIGLMNGKLFFLLFPNFNLQSIKPRILFFCFVFLFPWVLVMLYTYISTGFLFSFSDLLKFIPVVILLIPFLTINRSINTKPDYLPAKQFSIIDIILTASFIAISVVLVLVMDGGVTIS